MPGANTLASLFVLPQQIRLNSAGVPYANAYAYFYRASTLTAQDVYTTPALSTPHSQPVQADSAGQFPPIWLNPDAGYEYRVIIKTSANVQLDDYTITAVGLTQAGVGLALYPRTAAEIAAGVTPTNYAFYPRDGVNIKRFGVTGNGSTDDTTAFQNAFNSGEPLYVPRTSAYYKVSGQLVPAAAGQLIYGDGYLSAVRQVTANLNVFSASSLANLRFDNLRVTAVGSRSSSYNGNGIYLQECDNATVTNLHVEGHRGNGVMFHNCDDATAAWNRLTGSPVVANELHSQTGADILFYGGANRSQVAFNRCLSGNGYGIGIMKEFSADICLDNIISHNIISGAIGYGIFLYSTGLAGNFYRTGLYGNQISNITGSQRDAIDLQKYWGAGIYVVGAEKTVINGGFIQNVCQNTNNDTLAPGAIGVTAATIVDIDNVDIDTSAYYGITLRDPNGDGVAGGWANIGDGVTIRGTTKAAVQVQSRGNVRCDAKVEGSGAQGFIVANTTIAAWLTATGYVVGDRVSKSSTDYRCIVAHTSGTFATDLAAAKWKEASQRGFDIDMQIRGCTTTGINTDYASDIQVRGRIVGSTTQNLVFAHGDDIDVAVLSKDSLDTGVDFAATVTNARLHDSEITGNLVGVGAAANIRQLNNSVHDNTTNYTGTYALVRTLTNAATPSVKYGKHFVTGGTTTITNFTDGEPGQDIYIRSAHSLNFDVTGTSLIGGTTDLAAASGDLLQWRTDDGTNWYLVGFMKNSVNNAAGA